MPQFQILDQVLVPEEDILARRQTLKRPHSSKNIKVRPNNTKIPVFRITLPYLDLLVLPRIFQVLWKKYNFMHCVHV